MIALDEKQARAMNKQVKRVNNDPRVLWERIHALEYENEALRSVLKSRPDFAGVQVLLEWEQIGDRHYRHISNREAGTQTALAAILGVKPYTISRWVGKGKIPTVTTPDDRQSVWLDQKTPDRKKKSK